MADDMTLDCPDTNVAFQVGFQVLKVVNTFCFISSKIDYLRWNASLNKKNDLRKNWIVIRKDTVLESNNMFQN